MTDTTTTAAEAVDMINAIRMRRIDLDHTRRALNRAQASHADVAGALYRLHLAVLAAQEAGVVVPGQVFDPSTILGPPTPGVQL